VGEVTKAAYFGHDALVELRLEAGPGALTLSARTPGDAAPRVGSRVSVALEGEAHVLPPPGTREISSA
jgi:iron(III) transport system ATP-binding protein